MTEFRIGKLAQVVHVTDDPAGAAAVYSDVFAGRCYYEGYSPAEKRDASLLVIGDFVVEPMGPADEAGADQMPVGRFLGRFGSHLHSIALNVKGVPELYRHLTDHGVRVVGPGGIDPTAAPAGEVQSIYTHPKDTHCLLEFVDFGPELMPGSPRLDDGWDPSWWSTDHPLGIDAMSHVTVVVRDLDAESTFFTDTLGCRVFHESSSASSAQSRYLAIGSETVIELHEPLPESRGGADLAANGEIVHCVTLRSVDLDRAAIHLASSGIGLVDRTESSLVLDPADCHGALIALTVDALPGDPRAG